MMNARQLTAKRARTHGHWPDQAARAQRLKAVLFKNSVALSPQQHEALELIATKLSRIVSGDPNHADHWRDVAGYATLVAERAD